MRYIDANGSSQTANGVNTVSGTSNSFSTGWYAVTSNVINKNRIICTGDVHLILCDGCKLTAPQGIAVNSGKANLTIYGQTGGTGELYIEKPAKYGYNAGIGGDSSIGSGVITINGGKITATGSDYGAAIGGGYKGDSNVTINGGEITATGNDFGAAIGGGNRGGGTAIINGGKITANGGNNKAAGAAIGGGYKSNGTVTINGGEITANGSGYGAAIGGGYQGNDNVTINGGEITANGGQYSPAIGGGDRGNGTVIINGGNITANGSDCGAAIGGSYLSDVHVTINDGVIHATGSETSAAIGGGMKNSGTVTIKGGNIIANGGKHSAAIGGGREGSGTVTIDGGEITATGGETGAAIGGGREGRGTVTIDGGEITANGGDFGAAIGGSYKGDGNVTINDGIIKATGGNYAAAIGGGKESNGTVTVNGGEITANVRNHGAAIGGGVQGSYAVTINDGILHASSEYGGAAIGGGSDGNGTVIINGGNITATGGKYEAGGAAIGGGYIGDCIVTVNGGIVSATGGECSAAIGGGMKNSGTVTIKGGNIIANGGKHSAAIGGGREGSGTVTIDGGEITATGGEIGAAIGGRTECSYAVVIHGGHVSATAVGKGNGIGSGFSKSEGTVSLSWTNRTDIITASSYSGAVTLAKTFHAGASNSKIGTVYEAGAVSDNSTLTDKTIRPFYGFYPFLGHSISLNGDIGLNYYLNASAVNADLHFEWYNKTFDHTVTEADYDAASGCYKVQVNVAAAEMTCPIAATLTYAENDFVTDVYSVRDYADVILDSGSDFSKSYTAAYGAKKYDVLVDLIKKTLDYGTKAQTRFGVKDFKLANEDVKYTMQPITADHIKTQKTEMGDENLYKSGLNYIGTSVLFLSGTTLRHNYAVTDAYLLEQIKDTANFDFVNKGSRVCFERKNIPATQLDVDFVFTLGKSTYRYSVLDYCKLVIANESKSQTDRELAMATFWYNDAAKAYFYYSDEYDGEIV